MKRYRITNILLIFLLIRLSVQAQVNLIPNGSFEANCGTNNSCSTIAPNCVTDWFVSHGSPQLISGVPSFDGTASMRMWAKKISIEEGEGIGVNLNSKLVKDKRYILCFAYRTHTDVPMSPVNIRVRLVNSLTDNPACPGGMGGGGVVPSVSPMQEIYTTTFSVGTGWTVWTTVSTYFTANSNYSQMIVFPQTNQSNGIATLNVDYFSLSENIAPCQTPMDYDNTSIPVPAGIYDQKSVIRAGSHITNPSNPGIVTVNQPVQTKFAASNYIELFDNFIAYPERSYFLATIEYCDAVCQFTTDSNQQSRLGGNIENDQATDELSNHNAIFPNPASDQLTVQNSRGLQSAVLKDIAGRLVATFQPEAGKHEQVFRIPDVKAGIYFLTLTDESGKTEIKKIAIEK